MHVYVVYANCLIKRFERKKIASHCYRDGPSMPSQCFLPPYLFPLLFSISLPLFFSTFTVCFLHFYVRIIKDPLDCIVFFSESVMNILNWLENLSMLAWDVTYVYVVFSLWLCFNTIKIMPLCRLMRMEVKLAQRHDRYEDFRLRWTPWINMETDNFRTLMWSFVSVKLIKVVKWNMPSIWVCLSYCPYIFVSF